MREIDGGRINLGMTRVFADGDRLWNIKGFDGGFRVGNGNETVVSIGANEHFAWVGALGIKRAKEAEAHFRAEDTVSSISVVDIDSHPCPELEEILEAMKQEKGVLLQPSLKSLSVSYENKQACVLMDKERPVGYVRFSPLLDPQLKDKVGLSQEVPDVYEIGSAIILPDHRGKGYYSRLRNSLLRLGLERMEKGKLMVIGTTKNIRVAEVLPKAIDLGIDFYASTHGEFPGVQCLTCVCNPNFGEGVQYRFDCPKGIDQESLIQLKLISDWETHRKEVTQFSPDGKIPCVMYVSDKSLAQKTSDMLLAAFGSKELLAKTLMKVDYYE